MIARIFLAICCLTLLSGCAIEKGICIDGSNLTFDGEKASGRLRVVTCGDVPQVLHSVDVVNESVDGLFNTSNQSVNFSQLPIIKQGGSDE